MSKVTFDYSKAGCFIADHEVEAMKPLAEAAAKTLTEKTGAGNDFLGWIDLPVDYDNLPVLKQQLRRFRKIQRFFL